MAPLRIHIQQVRLEASTTGTELARPLPERFSQLFRTSLLAVLTDELTRHDLPGTLLRLPQLVLELPPVAAHRLEQDLPDHLRAALRQALAALPPAATSPDLLAAEQLATLRYYLLNGRLRWPANSTDFELNVALGQALRQHPAALRTLLRQVGQWLPPRQRLAQQLALPTLAQLLALLEPAHAPFVQAYLRDTLLAHYHHPLVAASAAVLRQVLHELALADLLGRQAQFNRSAFVERQLRQLATRYNLRYTALLSQLAATYAFTQISLPATARMTTLPGIIQGLQKAQVAAARITSTASQLLASKEISLDKNNYAALVYYIRHSSLPPTEPPLMQLALVAALAAVLRRGRGALLRLVQQAGSLGPAAFALAGALPPAQQQELVQQLAPRPASLPPAEVYPLFTNELANNISFEIAGRATLAQRLLRPAGRFAPTPAYGLAGVGALAMLSPQRRQLFFATCWPGEALRR
jgi:hypothetical protein